MRNATLDEQFRKAQGHQGGDDGYGVAGQKMTVDEKLAVLKQIGKPELVGLFEEWKPRTSNRKKRGAPLSQRVSVAVTGQERVMLDAELRQVLQSGEKITMSQMIRSRAVGSVDLHGWREIAERMLKELDDAEANEKKYRAEITNLNLMADEEDDDEVASAYMLKIRKIDEKLGKLVGRSEKRNLRLSGRMSMSESETVKWRAQRLCISSSDYLRMMIFSLSPDSTADAHMSLDAKRRFYISIIDVALNGWGTPPTIYECSQCENYMDEIHRLRDENARLRGVS